MNTNNLAQKTNYTAGSEKLGLLPFYLTSCNIPGVNLSHPELGSRSGVRLNVTGDTITYNNLSFEMLVDEDFNIYHEFMDRITENINPENGVFSAYADFDFWIDVNNNKGNKLFKIEFYNCRVENLGDIQLDTQDDMTEFLFSVELKFDYYKVIRSNQTPTLRT